MLPFLKNIENNIPNYIGQDETIEAVRINTLNYFEQDVLTKANIEQLNDLTYYGYG